LWSKQTSRSKPPTTAQNGKKASLLHGDLRVTPSRKDKTDLWGDAAANNRTALPNNGKNGLGQPGGRHQNGRPNRGGRDFPGREEKRPCDRRHLPNTQSVVPNNSPVRLRES